MYENRWIEDKYLSDWMWDDYRADEYDAYDKICDEDRYLEDEYDWSEPTMQQLQQWEDEYREMVEDEPWLGIWCGSLVNKVDRLLKSTSYKSYDPDHIHPDVAYRKAYRDPIHIYAHNHGFKLAVNNIQGLVKKHVDQKVSVVIWKLKNHVKYKHDWAFRVYANWFIESLLEKQNVWYNYLDDVDLKIENGYLRKKV